jgi:RND family efflux transporter MFP subunit
MPRTLPSLAALLALASGGCSRAPPAPEPARPAEPAVAPAPAARAATPSPLLVPERVRHAPRVVATGTLRARQSAQLAVSVPGTLERIAVARGAEVKAGALLAALDSGAAAAARSQAEAAVAAAVVQLALAEDALARTEEIGREGGASASQLFQVRSGRDLAAAQLAAARAQLEQARVHLAHHSLRAPFDGVVTRVPDGVGIAVSPGVPLFGLVGTHDLSLDTSLTQEEAAEVSPGARATVHVPASGVRTEEATVRVVVPAVDPATNRVPVEISVPNRDGRFLANAYARAELATGGERDAWKVPSAALAQREGGVAVWVAGPDGCARRLPVRLLGEEEDVALVAPEQTAWPEGLRVIGSPPLGIAEGTVVAEVGP